MLRQTLDFVGNSVPLCLPDPPEHAFAAQRGAAEQFGLDQAVLQRRRVDRDERAVVPWPEWKARAALLADARFALQQQEIGLPISLCAFSIAAAMRSSPVSAPPVRCAAAFRRRCCRGRASVPWAQARPHEQAFPSARATSIGSPGRRRFSRGGRAGAGA
jgi:hypothetical protein